MIPAEMAAGAAEALGIIGAGLGAGAAVGTAAGLTGAEKAAAGAEVGVEGYGTAGLGAGFTIALGAGVAGAGAGGLGAAVTGALSLLVDGTVCPEGLTHVGRVKGLAGDDMDADCSTTAWWSNALLCILNDWFRVLWPCYHKWVEMCVVG